jgi:hypothetical protein
MNWPGLTLSGVILAGSLAGCVGQATTGPFTQVARLESELKRGVSTKMDVQRVLGTPKGVGAALLPTDARVQEVWYYQDVKLTDIRSAGAGELRADWHQQTLLVMFGEGKFDGFIWYTATGTTAGE